LALRGYTDPSGVEWQVWRVVPTTRRAAEPRPDDRRKRPDPDYVGDRRRKPFVLTPGMETGWLCFQSAEEKRRLAPAPAGWETCDEATLGTYLSMARPVSPRVGDGARPDRLEAATR
jgi:hypothetical protein